MKILKTPDTKNWKTQVSCTQCTTELEIEFGDIKCKYQSGAYNYSVKCPTCDYEINIPKNSFNKAIETLLNKKAEFPSSSYYDR
jgi:hypothetical protein